MDHAWGRGSSSTEGGLIHPPSTAPSPVVALAGRRSVAARNVTIHFLLLLVTTACLETHPQLSRREQACRAAPESDHAGTHWPCRVRSASQAREEAFLLVPLKRFLLTVSSSRAQGAVI